MVLVADTATLKRNYHIMRIIFILSMALTSFSARLDARQGEEETQGSRAQRSFVTLALALGANGYNRVEGLPFEFGVTARSQGPEPFQGRAVTILRTARTIGLDAVGYSIRGEKLFLGSRRLVVGAEGYSELRAIERRGVSSIENSLSAAIFHTDYRDYYNRQGFVGYATYAPRNSSFSGGVEIRTERHDVIPSGNPESVFDNRKLWRAQPLVADGRVHSASASIRYDNRERRRLDRGSGWLIDTEIMQAFGGDLTFTDVILVLSDNTPGPPITGLPTMEATFTKASLDARRYNEIGDVSLNFRLAVGGVLNNEALPPQFQHALGGVGSLPGLPNFAEDPATMTPAMDCGARDFFVRTAGMNQLSSTFFPFYGCDRYVLFQAQLEGYFGFEIADTDLDFRDEGLAVNLELIPRWILFFDAAQAWALNNIGPFPRNDESRRYDAGGGIAFGDLGFYLGVPLAGDDKDVRFVVRLGGRF
jgi:hypothetical protein